MRASETTYSAIAFTAAILPVTVVLGVITYAMTRIDAMAGSPLHALVSSLAFMVLAAAGHASVVVLVGPARARLLRRWRLTFPVLCGVALSIFLFTGLVENSTDVIGRIVGRRFEYTMLVGTVLFWSVVATLLVVGIDRMLARAGGDDKQIA